MSNGKNGDKIKTYLIPTENLKSTVFCSTDGLRPGINGLIIDPEKLVTVATDGNFLVLTPLKGGSDLIIPKWQDVIPVKPGQIKIAFNPRLLIRLLEYWEKNVDKENITLEFYPENKSITAMVKAEQKETGVIALLAARRIMD